MNLRKSILLPLLGPAFGLLMAQPQAPPPPPPPPPPVPLNAAVVEFVGTEGVAITRSDSAVKGMPYSAEGINETVQVLADGNRISRKTSSSVYRDSQGRTRREHAVPSVGPWASNGEKLVTIFDPVARQNITLHPDKTATKIQLPNWTTSGGGGGGEMRTMTFERKVAGPTVVFAESHTTTTGDGVAAGKRLAEKIVQDVVIEQSGAATHMLRHPAGGVEAGVVVGGVASRSGMVSAVLPDKQSFRREELGKKVIEGVEADGTRNIMTIEAGQIGNDRPIEIIDETWYSKEIEALVYSKHSDPRTGETTYRLTNIRRGEQPIDLFEVPADYKVREGGVNKMDFKIRTRESKE